MRITEVRELSLDISRYRDPDVPSGGLTTSIVAVRTDVVRGGRPIIGYGFASVGRYAQGGLIRERFAPRLCRAAADDLVDTGTGDIDPVRAWDVMMAGEKPGGHGERCVAVGTLDMAVWDVAAKLADKPLHQLLADRSGRSTSSVPVPVYASGGYPYPRDDVAALADEVRQFVDLGFTDVKMKIGHGSLAHDLRRIDAALAQLGDGRRLAVDAMNAYGPTDAIAAANALAPYGLRWFEDICDPLDFDTQARVAAQYAPPIAAGEALFSSAEAKLLDRYGGLRRDRDILVFDPVHCYGATGYLRIVEALTAAGWPRRAFWPHGGQLFGLHVAAGLALGGAEATPLAFHPFHGPPPDLPVHDGHVAPPAAPGIGFELHDDAWRLFQRLGDG